MASVSLQSRETRGARGALVGSPEQSRAREPDAAGILQRNGVRISWERHGAAGPHVLLLPTWSIVHSRFWKMQVPYLARFSRVVTFDGRGNGRSDRPGGSAEDYSVAQFAEDALAVMDASGLERAVLLSLSCGALWATALAAEHPERVQALVYIGPAVPLAPGHPERAVHSFEEPLESEEGWAKDNVHYWRRDYRGYLEFFFEQCFNEEHSSKAIEDCVSWGLETDPDTLANTARGLHLGGSQPFFERLSRVSCPTLVVHGDRDLVRPHAQGAALAKATGGRLVTLEDAGHIPNVRDPVAVNLLLRDFIANPPAGARRTRAATRRRRALYVSSPIGLGHARRDLAIARELRGLHPDLEIDWLAQHPVTALLEDAGERIHPASRELASESAHFAGEARTHELNCFQALRRMDEVLLANFMVFTDVVRDEPYDLWIGDEAWELDYYLHENPELKTAAFAWLTDFVGYLPMPEGGGREAELTADYNAEMIEQVERYPRVRDRAIFVGDPADAVEERFGPGLPGIREWTERNYDFAGYVLEREPVAPEAREALREALGYRPDEQVCLVTVGGSGVGEALLARLGDAFVHARELVPGLRMILIAGPRIDPSGLPTAEGLEVRSYVPDLPAHLAACDLAAVQGGLATAMELIAAQRPFLYFPLKHHFEQQIHVRHRVERHRGGRAVDFDDATPERLAQAIAEEIGREVDYEPVAAGGAERAAALIAELL